MRQFKLLLIIIIFHNIQIFAQQGSFITVLDSAGFISPFAVMQTNDDGWIVGAGTAENFNNRYVAIKLDNNGDIEWETLINNPEKQCFGYNLCINNGNGYVMAGQSYEYAEGASNPYHFNGGIMLLNNSGDSIWSGSYGAAPSQGQEGSFNEELFTVCLTTSNNIAAAGYSHSYSNNNKDAPWIVCIDQDGNKLWDYTYQDHAYGGYFFGICAADNGGVIAVGSITDPDKVIFSTATSIIVKLDSSGEPVWDKHWRHNGLPTMIRSVKKMNNGNYVIAGIAHRCLVDTVDCSLSPTIAVISEDGDVLWSKIFAYDSDQRGSIIYGLDITANDEILIAGSIDFYDAYDGQDWAFGSLIKTDKYGNLIWDRLYGDNNHMCQFMSVCHNSNDNSISMPCLYQYRSSDSIQNTILFVKTDSSGNSTLPVNTGYTLYTINEVNDKKEDPGIVVYPNPAGEYIVVGLSPALAGQDIEIVDMAGICVYKGKPGASGNIINTEELSPGLYIIRFSQNKYSKFIKY
ncbi:MAG: T9SS type A sorting domain-containing protein [Bacteroidales bacterium]|nr:T9SS type A sorting domain-containing protein [Bacteroidales bacterium]